MVEAMWNAIADAISQASDQVFELRSQDSIGGGCISSAWRIVAEDGRTFFVKTHQNQYVDMFAAEAEGLSEINSSHTIKAPAPVTWGETGNSAYLVMDYLPLGGSGSQVQLAEDLAAMHRHQESRYGWHLDNTIGSTPQPNTPTADWCEFWRQQRLGFQLQLAASKGYAGSLQRKGERLLAELDIFLAGHEPPPSLLHGDLWSGNYSFTQAGEPVIFDPAVYYGDREADIAMTELFGGFGGDFYAAYNNAWPLDPGYKTRKTLYNLYHILNHLNLFGGGYGSQAEGLMDRLLSDV
jgi:fructosamine-3-kinase